MALEEMLREAAEEPSSDTPPKEEVAEEPKTEEPAEAVTDEPAETPAEDDGDFFKYVKDQFGEDLTEVFKTPEEAVKGLLEARRMVGRRDEDAQYGNAVKALLQGREKDLAAFLAGSKPEQDRQIKAIPENVEDFPEEAENWVLQIRQDDKGEMIPAPGAPSDIVDKYKAYSKAVQKRLMEMARSWPKIKQLPDAVNQTAAGIQQQQLALAEEKAILDWQAQYKSVLFVDGNEKGSLTPEGKRVEAEFLRLRDENPDMRVANAFKEATKQILGDVQRASKQVPKPKPTAAKSAGVAVTETKYKSIEDEVEKRIDKGESFVTVMMDVKRRLASGAIK